MRTAVIGCVAIAGGFVLLYRLGTPSWNFDEYYYGLVGHRFLSGRFDVQPGLHPYLGVYLLGLFPRLTGEDSEVAVRILPALAGLGTGVVLLAFGQRAAGLWGGVLAFALWTLLPHASEMAGAALAEVKIERFGLLDSFMELFIASALFAGWEWSRTWAWRWAISTGVLAGLAVSSKLAGAVVLVPILILAAASVRDTRGALQLLAIVVLPLVVFALSFAPVLSEAPDRLRAIRDLARQEEAAGHATIVGGRLYLRDPPWWANAWFMWKGVGPLATAGLVGAAAAGLVTVERRLALYLGAAVAAPFVALPALYSVSLPHYYFIWMAPLTLLAALGVAELAKAGGPRRVLAGLAVAVLGIAMIATVVDVARLREGDYKSAARVLREAGVGRGPVAVLGYAPVLCAYLPDAAVIKLPDPNANALVVDPVQAQRGDPSGLQGLVGRDPSAYEQIRRDRLWIYLRRRPVAAPKPLASRGGLACYAG